MNVVINPGVTYRFAVSSTDTIPFFYNVTPATFTSGGVTLTSASLASIYHGAMPGPGSNLPAGLQVAFNGAIRFTAAGSGAPDKPGVTASKTTVCRVDQSTLTFTKPAYLTSPIYKVYNPSGTLVYSGSASSYTINFGPGFPDGIGGDWKVTVTDPNCGNVESSVTIITITRVLPPAPGLDGKMAFCINDPFTPVTVLGSNPSWYYSATGGSPLPFVPPFNTTWAHRDTYYVGQTIGVCPSEFRTQVIYSAAPKPNPPLVTTPLFYCENDTAVQVSAKGENLMWFYQSSGGLGSSVAPKPNTTKKDTFQYWVSQNVDGCESGRAPVKAIVTFRPNGLILVSRDHICENDTITLNYYGSAFVGSGYDWTFPPGTEIWGGNLNGPLYIKLDSAGLRPIQLQVGHSNCYSQLYSKTITIDTIPTAVIEARPNICQGQRELISLSEYTMTTDSFFWDFMDGKLQNYSTDQGPYGLIWEVPGKKVISLRMVNKLCSVTYTDTVNVHPRPDAKFAIGGYGSDKQFCEGDSLLMTPNTVAPSSTYSWTPARYFDNYSNASVAWGHIDHQGYIKLNVTDQYGCMNSDSLMVLTKPCCQVFFPNAFTPNGDGTNDLFRIVPTTQVKTSTSGVQRNLEIRTFRITNRWGQTVYESANQYGAWDGKINGKDADLGNYNYYLRYKCGGQDFEQKGDFILIR
jgi:gliding motility-associated-like protein